MTGRGLFPKVIPQLDGVRGLAILLVLVAHAEGYRLIELGGWGKKGWVGVDLFFVLSGFLITGILTESRGRPHYFRNFYGRRALRILPVYAAVIAGAYLLMTSGALPETAHAYSWAAYIFLIQNVVISSAGFHALGATWSLAVEEHFYLLWPALVRRVGSATLMQALLLIIVLSPMARLVAWGFDVSRFFLYKHTLLRLDGLAMGALLALWLGTPSFTLQRLRRAAWVALAVGVPLSLWTLGAEHEVPVFSLLNKTPVSLMFLGVVATALLASRGAGWGSKAWAAAPLRFFGRISYCLYLVHIPVLDIVTAQPIQQRLQPWFGRYSVSVTLATFLFVSIGLATLSWYGFERRVLRLKRHFADEKIPEPQMAAAASV